MTRDRLAILWHLIVARAQCDMTLIEAIIHKDFNNATDIINERMNLLKDKCVLEMKKIVASKLDENRINIVKVRIRNGKVQRRKKVSNVPGMTFRGGKLKRMSAAERRHRKLAARKDRGKKTQILRRRKMSLMKRKRLGV